MVPWIGLDKAANSDRHDRFPADDVAASARSATTCKTCSNRLLKLVSP